MKKKADNIAKTMAGIIRNTMATVESEASTKVSLPSSRGNSIILESIAAIN